VRVGIRYKRRSFLAADVREQHIPLACCYRYHSKKGGSNRTVTLQIGLNVTLEGCATWAVTRPLAHQFRNFSFLAENFCDHDGQPGFRSLIANQNHCEATKYAQRPPSATSNSAGASSLFLLLASRGAAVGLTSECHGDRCDSCRRSGGNGPPHTSPPLPFIDEHLKVLPRPGCIHGDVIDRRKDETLRP